MVDTSLEHWEKMTERSPLNGMLPVDAESNKQPREQANSSDVLGIMRVEVFAVNIFLG
jgi:hypothetical protein